MKNILIYAGTFAVFTALHFAYTAFGFFKSYGKYESLSFNDYLLSYQQGFLHFKGLAFGLLGFFGIYVLRTYLNSRDFHTVRAGTIAFLLLFTAGYLSGGINHSTGMFDYFMDKVGYFYVYAQHAFLFMSTFISVLTGTIIIFFTRRKR